MPKTIHPTSRTLVAYLDGELPVEKRRELAAHLRGCPGCQSDLEEIEADLDWHLVLDAAVLPRQAPLEAEGLQRLLGSIHEWRRTHPAQAARATEAETRRGVESSVGRALEVFFGAGAAGAVTRLGSEPEALFSAFLGQRAASALMRQIRNRTKMDRFLAPDMT